MIRPSGRPSGRRAARGALALALVCVLAARGDAQPGSTTSEVLREGNAAALAGDWPRLAQLVAPLFARPLAAPDLAEAHRLAGIAAFFEQRRDDAEAHLVAYLRIDLDGRLDPALYPPEVVAFCNDVASRHAAELRALRTRPSRSWLLTLVPPLGQLQNGERTKAYVIGGALGVALVVNLTTYAYLARWCERTSGPAGGALNCRDSSGRDRTQDATALRPYNIASGVGAVLIYAYGVYDGVQGYRRRSREQAIQPFITTTRDSSVLGVTGSF